MMEYTSAQIGRIAAKGIKRPTSLSSDEIRAVCASALTQRPDRKKKKAVK